MENNNNSFSNFFIKYKKAIYLLGILILIVGIVAFFNYQSQTKANEEAAEVYSEWSKNFFEVKNSNELENDHIINLIDNYRSSGYTMLALLQKGNFEASEFKTQKAIETFTILNNISKKNKNSKVFLIISTVNLARLNFDLKEYDVALKHIESIPSISNQGYVNELIGDIFLKKEDIKKADKYFQIAYENYLENSDQTSANLLKIKLAALDINL